MNATGYLEQKNNHPLSFTAVLLLHGAAIAAVLLVKGPGWIVEPSTPTEVINIPLTPPPDPNVPPPPSDPLVRQAPVRSLIDVPVREIEAPTTSTPMAGNEGLVVPGPVIGTNPGPATPGPALAEIPRVPPREPVRVEAQFDPRFAGALQPPYPAVEQRNEREGSVRVRVTIGPDGRVIAVSQVSATSDAFWRVTERQALTRWRFRPATVDGDPVQTSKVLTVQFRLDGR